MEAVFWYNMVPRRGLDEIIIPQGAVLRYVWRHHRKVVIWEIKCTADINIGEEIINVIIIKHNQQSDASVD